MKSIIITLTFLLTAQFSISAKEQSLKSRLQEYYSNNMHSILLQWHNHFDASISEQDLQQLKTLRNEAKDLKLKKKAILKEIRIARKINDEAKLVEARESLKSLREPFISLLKKVKPIAINNKDQLLLLKQQSASRIKEWKTEIKDIVQDWTTKHPQKAEMAMRIFNKRFGFFMNADTDIKKKIALARFLLWDGSEPNHPINSANNDISLEIGNHPNPFHNQTTISFSISKQAKVVATIIDMNGKSIETIADGDFTAGTHSINFIVKNEFQQSCALICRFNVNGAIHEHIMQYVH